MDRLIHLLKWQTLAFHQALILLIHRIKVMGNGLAEGGGMLCISLTLSGWVIEWVEHFDNIRCIILIVTVDVTRIGEPFAGVNAGRSIVEAATLSIGTEGT